MAKINNMPMIGHVFYRSKMIASVDLVCIATCDKEIFDYIESIKGLAVMTSESHERATERTAEALKKITKKYSTNFDIVAMIQGDEPTFDPEDVDRAISTITSDSNKYIVNLMNRITSEEDFLDCNTVKVVVDNNCNALYFSREPIPSDWKNNQKNQMLVQTGLIVFRAEYLERFLEMEPTKLEKIESCDMLRVLEHGDQVLMLEAARRSIGVDTASDLEVAERLMIKDPIALKYNT